MTNTGSALVYLLQSAAGVQLAIALLNLFLVRLLKWRADLDRMPLLLREVFQVHAWFISLTLLIFGTITLRFAHDLARGFHPLAQLLAAGIGLFWAVRTVLQVAYYSRSHWFGRTGRTMIHIACLGIYGSLATVYLWASFRVDPAFP